ncbi:glucokinase [Thermanaeromonas toyohensis ToBE]|uniref:Glucokinase n=1 Tax=Thermanaeromonas toyohensis ToBE TaxID=698762 RepID=A0A1W1VMU3_9FIRM|nr:glucokinase [Thermanaeromonas toyohensis ToBE]
MYFLGIDLGGTTIKGGIVDKTGNILTQGQVPTRAEAGAEAVLAQIENLTKELKARVGISDGQLRGAGIGIPGSVDVEKGLVRLAPNLHWRNFPLRGKLEKLLGIPVVLDNDAHVAALGEMWQGAGRDYQDILMITIGTGIGSAVILNGQVHRGIFGYGAEMGHVKVEPHGPLCECGGRGCLETLASATAIVRQARQELERGRPSLLRGKETLEARDVLVAAGQGDELAREVLNRAAGYLGIALANAVLLIGPTVVILGGGVAQAGEVILGPLKERFEEALGPWQIKPLPLLLAQLGNKAGFVGAAYLALSFLRGEGK